MYTVSRLVRYEEIIKRSRFVAFAAPVRSRQDALELVDELRDPAASHNCFAYRCGAFARTAAGSASAAATTLQVKAEDDGEPSGTAGRPILSAIESNELDGVLVLVVRYFGGIKLGAGGLVRAYGGVAQKCLKLADRVEIVEYSRCSISAPFECLGTVFDLVNAYAEQKEEAEYSTTGVSMQFTLQESKIRLLEDELQTATRGSGSLHRLHD
ncbi:IMPACT family member in pol 5'region [Porphyridium purpureum]|uniref:IMPACT family member in pol 5'region n=1 Tax=Porphyridium purpureum TaxID=35688 RepID=A0A5J4Z364_PORPP|nr:IMPACT family member in pol 5'region [Porphyridium purpureum]|eukprot:POR4294..scf208_2